MFKRIAFYVIIIFIVAVLLVTNYSSVQKCENINITSITNENNAITVKGELKGNFRSIKSVKTEKIGNSRYIKVEAVNSFFEPQKEFSTVISNINNSVEKIYLMDKETSVQIYINSNYLKPSFNFGEGSISSVK